jgi:hypothetical protein
LIVSNFSGHVYYQDLTGYLKEYSYFASYNIPFFKAASQISGFEKKVFLWGEG